MACQLKISAKYNSIDLKNSVLEDLDNHHAISSQCHSQESCHFKISPDYNSNSKSSVSLKISKMNVQSLSSVSIGSSAISRSSPEYSSFNAKSSFVPGDLNSDCGRSTQPLPQCHQQMVISRSSSKYRSTNSQDLDSTLLVIFGIIIISWHRVLRFLILITMFLSDCGQFMYVIVLIVFLVKSLILYHCT